MIKNLRDFQKIAVKHPYLLIGIVFLLINANGSIISGKCNLKTGQGIYFYTQNIRIITDTVYGSLCGYYSDSCCDDAMFDSVDFSYFNTHGIWDVFNCGGGDVTGMRSKDTIWDIKNAYKVDFSKQLALSDTSLFKTAKYIDSCHQWTGISFAVDGDICFDYKWPKTFFVLKTSMRRYVLIVIDSQRVSINPASQCSGIIHWYLQQDGSTNFNGVNLEIIRNKSGDKKYCNTSPTLEYVWPGKKNIPGTSYFDCQGRKIRGSPGKLWRGNQILIKGTSKNYPHGSTGSP